MDESIIKSLYAPFELKQRKGLGGMTFDYISSDDVINRMNRVFEGCWRTEVRHEQQIDDFVLVRVRVHVYDPNTKIEYFHDGYGSASIARYNSGQNQGKMIDIGNAYKSAESMAIRNACTRFGVGLYLKEGRESIEKDPRPTSYKEYGIPDSPPQKVPVLASTAEETKAVSEVPAPPAPPTTPKPSTPKKPVAPPAPPAPPQTDNVKEEVATPSMPSIPKPTVPKAAKKEVPSPPPTLSSPKPADTNQEPIISGGDSKISDVQKAAVKGILSLKDFKFPELVKESFEHEGLEGSAAPESIDDLSYKEAIMVIKYGNEVFRQK